MTRRTSVAAAIAILAVGSLLAACSGSPKTTPSTTSATVNVVHDVSAANGGGTDLRLDACTPKHSAKKLPIVVIVHGGSFETGEYSDLDWLCVQGAQHGFAAFTVEYRRLPAAFPSQLEDIAADIAFIRAAKQAQRYDLDTSTLTIIGASAGAIIAAELLTGVPDDPMKPSDFTAGVLLSGAYDFTAKDVEGTSSDGLKVVLGYTGCATIARCARIDDVSAEQHVSKGDPPMLLENSTDELVPLSQARSMAAALTVAGIQHRLLIEPGTNHAEFIPMEIPAADAAVWTFLESAVR